MNELGRLMVADDVVVSTMLDRPREAHALLVLAHGAGAGMRHRFMEALAGALVARGVAVFRYQFPWLEAGRRRVDQPAVLEATVRSAVAAAAAAAPDLPRFAGGKSLGGRMSSRAAALASGRDETDRGAVGPGASVQDALAAGASGVGAHASGRLGLDVRGLVFFGFPLHPPGRPGVERAAHLPDVPVPMLFLQGTRDALADPDLIHHVTSPLPQATLHSVDGADHGFAVLKRSGRTGEEVMAELADTAAGWMKERTG